MSTIDTKIEDLTILIKNMELKIKDLELSCQINKILLDQLKVSNRRECMYDPSRAFPMKPQPHPQTLGDI
jgi:hypothetical protein